MNETEVTIAGRVVADPEHRTTRAGMQFTTFRLASTVRRRNREGVYVDGATSFYNVAAYRALGMNSHVSLRKGDPVLVHGRVTINNWQRADESYGSSAEVEALSIGHDLTFGTTEYTKAVRGVVDATAEHQARQGYEEMVDRLEGEEGRGWGTTRPGWDDAGTNAPTDEGEEKEAAVPA